MLTKLLKHEFIATWKVPAALDAVLIGLGILAHLMLRAAPFVRDSMGFVVLMILFIGVYYIGIIAANIVTLGFLVMRYYKNLYTSEGYLTFTLPVSTESIINAKVISGFLWMLLSVISTVLSVLITLTGVIGMADVPYEEFMEAADGFMDMLREGQSVIAAIILVGIATSLYSVLSLYFSVTVGQLWEKHKILGAVLCYIGIYILNLIITQGTIITSGMYSIMDENYDREFGRLYAGMLNRSTIISAVLSIAFYAACIIITKRKVNLD